jgi:hypothetical protein
MLLAILSAPDQKKGWTRFEAVQDAHQPAIDSSGGRISAGRMKACAFIWRSTGYCKQPTRLDPVDNLRYIQPGTPSTWMQSINVIDILSYVRQAPPRLNRGGACFFLGPAGQGDRCGGCGVSTTGDRQFRFLYL